MPRARSFFVACLLAIAAPVAAAPSQVTILHVNDTHSHLAPWGPKDRHLDGTLGGLGRAAMIVAATKAADPTALFVHAGDLFNGDPFFNEYLGVPELLLLESVGLDVFVPGNHEFQFGPEFLAGVLAGAWPAGAGSVSIIDSNLDLSGYPVLGAWIGDTVMKDAGGVKVGFFGLTIDDFLAIPEPATLDQDFAAVAARAVAKLRDEGADVVVCVSHLGIARSRAVAAAVPDIDVIVNAHDHLALAQPEVAGHTLIVSAGSYYRYVGRLRLEVDDGAVRLLDYALLDVDRRVAPLAPVQAQIDALTAGVVARFGDIYHEVLAWAEWPIPNRWDDRHAKRDTATGNLLTDAYRAHTRTDIAVEAMGFLDEAIPAGPVVGVDLFRAMGYGLPVVDPAAGRYIVAPARLVTFKLSGAELLAVLDFAIKEGGDLFPQVSGLRLTYDSSLPIDRPWVDARSVHVNGHKLVPGRMYSITANEVLIWGLTTLGLPIHEPQTLEVSAFDAVRAYVDARCMLWPITSGRLRDTAR